eukprot:jgi/Bigna1/128071/aug1.5_g2779
MFVKRRRPSIFVGSGDGRIFCVHPFSKGSHYNWQCSTGIYYESFLKGLPPAPILVVLSMDGTLIAWDAESKRPSPLAQDTTHEDAINCGMILENSKDPTIKQCESGTFTATLSGKGSTDPRPDPSHDACIPQTLPFYPLQFGGSDSSRVLKVLAAAASSD